MPEEMEREKKCRGPVIQGGSTVAQKQQGSGRRTEDPVGWGLNPVSFSQELGVLDLAPCPSESLLLHLHDPGRNPSLASQYHLLYL